MRVSFIYLFICLFSVSSFADNFQCPKGYDCSNISDVVPQPTIWGTASDPVIQARDRAIREYENSVRRFNEETSTQQQQAVTRVSEEEQRRQQQADEQRQRDEEARRQQAADEQREEEQRRQQQADEQRQREQAAEEEARRRQQAEEEEARRRQQEANSCENQMKKNVCANNYNELKSSRPLVCKLESMGGKPETIFTQWKDSKAGVTIHVSRDGQYRITAMLGPVPIEAKKGAGQICLSNGSLVLRDGADTSLAFSINSIQRIRHNFQGTDLDLVRQ